ncbi:MAG: hypothetical protein J7L54_03210 [Elusimicrobia bacterium]|nr:hypothetical protein [Elusimicrobiota bacterium]
MTSLNFSKIYYTKDALNFPLSKKIIRRFADAKLVAVDSPRSLCFRAQKEPQTVSECKKNLFLTTRREGFIEKCPGTKGHLCCNYFVTKNILGCPMDCSYCYLQAYLNIKATTIFVNENDFFAEFEKAAQKALRIGSGEFSDSLIFDEIVDQNKTLIEICSKSPSLLELKTKSANIRKLLNLNHRGKTVIAWSINPQKIIETEERKTSSVYERATAAQAAVEAGYPVAFHFDPIIHFKNWEKEYKKTVDAIFPKIPPGKIAWVSIGALRFYPSLKPIVRERFPRSKILLGEFIRGDDGKFRYLKSIRTEMFKKISGFIRKFGSDIKIYLCMESAPVWRKTFGRTPEKIKNLDLIFR